MSSGEARHGRRDNGLVAAEYAAAGDVDPRVGEHLLDVLALDGIAAYLRPSTDLHPITRQTFLPARPTDRLYVDRAHLATARTYLARLADESAEAPSPDPRGTDQHRLDQHGPEPTHLDPNRPDPNRPDPSRADPTKLDLPRPDPTKLDLPRPDPTSDPRGGGHQRSDADTDDEWAKIIAGYDVEVDTVRRAWPAAEDLADRVHDPSAPDSSAPDLGPFRARGQRISSRPAETDEPSLLDGLDTFGANLPDEDEEGYTPPAPPPMPRPSMPTVLGVAGIVGGLAVFLRPDLTPIGENTAMVMAFLAIMAGFATLVWRLRPGDDDEDSDPDDGARV